MKKGQGLSVQTIIIAIIVLVVLVVLVAIFTGFFASVFNPGVNSCASYGGQCADAEVCTARLPGGDAECERTNEVCCALLQNT